MVRPFKLKLAEKNTLSDLGDDTAGDGGIDPATKQMKACRMSKNA
jgi:hypothetical protein